MSLVEDDDERLSALGSPELDWDLIAAHMQLDKKECKAQYARLRLSKDEEWGEEEDEGTDESEE